MFIKIVTSINQVSLLFAGTFWKQMHVLLTFINLVCSFMNLALTCLS